MATDREDREGKASTRPDAGPKPFSASLAPVGVLEQHCLAERFLTEFGEMSMQKAVLPCSMGGLGLACTKVRFKDYEQSKF